MDTLAALATLAAIIGILVAGAMCFRAAMAWFFGAEVADPPPNKDETETDKAVDRHW